MRRASFLAIAIACLLALPAVALAQSAPDTQYQDPLANPNNSTRSTPKSSSGSTTPSQSPSSGAGTSGSSGTAGTSTSSGTAATTAASSGLPRTGGHPELLALVGVALLGGGFALRRAARA